MIDWVSAIMGILGLTTAGSVVGVILFYRENKKKANAEAKQAMSSAAKEDASAAKELLEVLNGTKDFMEEMNKYSKETASQLLSIVKEKDTALKDAQKKDTENSYKIANCERQIKGLQKVVETEIAARKNAEANICLVEDCMLRKPPLGTYKKEAI